MVYTEHRCAETFLVVARPALELHESVNGLMLGVSLRLVGEPNAYGSAPYLEDGKQFCTLYTDLSNASSNSMYRRIGCAKVADVLDIYFQSKADNHQIPPTS